MIPRELLFGNPDKVLPTLSPDGKRLAWLAPDNRNVLQVWVKTIGQDDVRAITADKKRGIRRYLWAPNSKVLLYLQDVDGDENWHLFGVNLDSGESRDFTPYEAVQARLTGSDAKFPDVILISLNLRDKRLHDVYRLNVNTGALLLDNKNPGDVLQYWADPKFVVRAAKTITRDGGTELRIRDDERSDWRSWMKVGPEETLEFVDFTADGGSAIVVSSVGRNTSAVVERDISSGKEKRVASSEEADVDYVMIHPTRHVVEAVAFTKGRREWRVIDPGVKSDFEGIAKLEDGDFFVASRNADDTAGIREDGAAFGAGSRTRIGRIGKAQHGTCG